MAATASSHIMEKLMNDYKCTICLENFIDATSTSCRHVFCRFCLTNWLQFSPKCPQCHSTVNSCTPMESIDAEIDNLFHHLPASLCKDRDDVKQRRRKLEMDSFTSNTNSNNATQSKAVLEKLRSQREKSIKNEGLYKEGNNDGKKMHYIKVPDKDDKLQLPRLVSTEKLSEKIGSKSKASNGNTCQYENVKLPPIKTPAEQRQTRGILTTTSSTQKMEDKFPIGMEGDIQGDTSAEENIRELERRNKILEEQLFGAYDRIMDVIKQSNTDVANTMDPNIFRNSGTPLKQSTTNGQEPSFSKESMIANSKATAEENASQQQQRSNDVEDLLAETEDLIEIEDFLKKFPFERIRDDDTLINYDDDEDDEGDVKDILDSDLLEDIVEPRSSKCNKPLNVDQLEIENFYKKLEVRQQKIGAIAKCKNALPQPPRIPKSVTQETSASKMKRLPSLKKFEHNQVQLPTRMQSSNSLQTNGSPQSLKANRVTKLASAVEEKATDTKGTKNVAPSSQRQQLERPTVGAKSSTTSLRSVGSKTSVTSAKQQRQKPGSNQISESPQPAQPPVKGKLLDDLDSLLDPSAGLNYEDFLKLEIDFLDGDGDWKEFEQPPEPLPTRGLQPSGTPHTKDSSKRLQSFVRTGVKGGQGRIKIVNQNPVGVPIKNAIANKGKKSAADPVEINYQTAPRKK